MELTSDDPADPVATIALVGDGLAPALELDPTALDLGTVTLGCAAKAVLTLSNGGNLDLTVEEVSLEDPGGALLLEGLPALPLVMAPGQSVPLKVAYLAVDERSDDATLTLLSDDPQTPAATVSISTEGLATGWALDSYIQDVAPPLDLLVAVDTSASMGIHWDIEAQLTAFPATARARAPTSASASWRVLSSRSPMPWRDRASASVPAAHRDLLCAPGGRSRPKGPRRRHLQLPDHQHRPRVPRLRHRGVHRPRRAQPGGPDRQRRRQ